MSPTSAGASDHRVIALNVLNKQQHMIPSDLINNKQERKSIRFVIGNVLSDRVCYVRSIKTKVIFSAFDANYAKGRGEGMRALK